VVREVMVNRTHKKIEIGQNLTLSTFEGNLLDKSSGYRVFADFVDKYLVGKLD
jgi:hypothetical protein